MRRARDTAIYLLEIFPKLWGQLRARVGSPPSQISTKLWRGPYVVFDAVRLAEIPLVVY